MVEKFKGNNPKNARIKIDYSGVKPKVTFSYPSKKYGVTGSMLPFIFLFWVLILLISCSIYILITPIETTSLNQTTNFSDYSGCFDYHLQKVDEAIDEICSTPILSSSEKFINEFKEDFIGKLLALLLVIIPPLLIYFPFKKFWANVYPIVMAGSKSDSKIAKFNPKDVKYNSEDGYHCEIPVFNNVVLDYFATKDFSKYLKLFEIEEHKFRYYRPKEKNRKKKLTKRQKKERRKDMLNDYLWYAKFHFSQKPKIGSLEVIFK